VHVASPFLAAERSSYRYVGFFARSGLLTVGVLVPRLLFERSGLLTAVIFHFGAERSSYRCRAAVFLPLERSGLPTALVEGVCLAVSHSVW